MPTGSNGRTEESQGDSHRVEISLMDISDSTILESLKDSIPLKLSGTSGSSMDWAGELTGKPGDDTKGLVSVVLIFMAHFVAHKTVDHLWGEEIEKVVSKIESELKRMGVAACDISVKIGGKAFRQWRWLRSQSETKKPDEE